MVGLKVPRYHLFGDSVTIASLMESTGQPSKVQVSQTAYELLKLRPDLYEFEFREEVNLGTNHAFLCCVALQRLKRCVPLRA